MSLCKFILNLNIIITKNIGHFILLNVLMQHIILLFLNNETFKIKLWYYTCKLILVIVST